MVRQEGRPRGWAREFSRNLFFCRRRSFDSLTPQQSRHLRRLGHQLFPSPLLLLAITRGDLTPSAPPAPLPEALGGLARASPGTHLCAGHRVLGVGEGSCHPPPLGSTTGPFLSLTPLKCNDDPVPSLTEGSLPCHGQAGRPSRQGLGATQKTPAVASPNTLGDQII